MTAHWGQPDPAAVVGTDLEKVSAFREAFRILERRIELFTALPIASLEQLALGNKVVKSGGPKMTARAEPLLRRLAAEALGPCC